MSLFKAPNDPAKPESLQGSDGQLNVSAQRAEMQAGFSPGKTGSEEAVGTHSEPLAWQMKAQSPAVKCRRPMSGWVNGII